MTFLSVNGLSSRYFSSQGPVYAVDDVDFELDSGESLGIAGESACGKSTLGLSLIRMISGGESFGKVVFDGDSILDLSESDFDNIPIVQVLLLGLERTFPCKWKF